MNGNFPPTARPHQSTGSYPSIRLRRNRRTPWLRRLVGESVLTVNDLVWPLFVVEGVDQCQPIATMPGVHRLSCDLIIDAVGEAKSLGIPAVAVFPHVDASLKNEDCREAINPDNLVCRATRAIKAAHPDIGVICDVALDPFSSHGHDGLVREGIILNDKTIEVLCQQALVQSQSGCDIVAPSDMMDGRVQAIRRALDGAGFDHVAILSYAAKYASAFYGPFRDAVGSGGALKGDKKTYQMDPANAGEAFREVGLDIDEGADMIIVKPGMPYLDVLYRLKNAFGIPTFAYQVSGEYAMIRHAAENGCFAWEDILIETLLSFKRAGADAILTYGALDAARLLRRCL